MMSRLPPPSSPRSSWKPVDSSRVTAFGPSATFSAENYFPSVPFHGGFGLLNLHGIAKPAYRAFQLLHRSGTELLEVHGTHATVDAWVIRKNDAATILITNLAMPRHPIQTELLNLRLHGRASAAHRLDRTN